MAPHIAHQEQIDQYFCSQKSVFALARKRARKRQSQAQPKEDFLYKHGALFSPL